MTHDKLQVFIEHGPGDALMSIYRYRLRQLHDEVDLSPEETDQALANLGGRPPPFMPGSYGQILCGACVGIYLTGYGLPGEEHECGGQH